MVLARASPVTKLINGITVDVARLPRSEQRALWLDVFDLDWRPADPSALNAWQTLDSCTDKDLWRIRSREMYDFVSSGTYRSSIIQVALRNDWLDVFENAGSIMPTILGGAGLTLAQLRSAVDRFKVKITSEMAIACADSCGVDVMQWLHTVIRRGGWRKAVMDTAARAGNFDVVEWLHNNVTTGCTKDAMDDAAANGHLRVVEFLHSKRREGCTTGAMDGAAANGHLDVVEFLHNNRREGCSVAAMDNAAANGHLDVVEFLHNNRTEGCTTNAMDEAAANGHLRVVEWLHNNRAEGCTTLSLGRAAANRHLAIVRFLLRHHADECVPKAAQAVQPAFGFGFGSYISLFEGQPNFGIDSALINGHAEIARLLLASGNILPKHNVVGQAIREGSAPIFNLIIDFGLHRHLMAEDLVSWICSVERLQTICEHSSDERRAELMRALARRGKAEWMVQLHAIWPSAIGAVTLDDVWSDLNRLISDSASSTYFCFANVDLLDFVITQKPDLLGEQTIIDILTLAVRNLAHDHIVWVRRRFLAVFAAHPASKIDGEPADAIIDALAESGVHSPPEALEQAIKRGDAATVKWLRDNIFVNNDKLRRRAEWFLKRG